jgi:hypothetical protein
VKMSAAEGGCKSSISLTTSLLSLVWMFLDNYTRP